ncbi:MAG: sulfite exporter TauE/SafE family protein [Clostridia bacterium]|nr:sulfite exporter TauE/SafE family protein [Clostridia bacterium]
MQYIISFLEGLITFISPCLLPLLSVYISYFASGNEENTAKTLVKSLGFVLGFTLVFILLGAFAASLGALLSRYQTAVNIVTGLIVIVFGLNFSGVFKLNLFNNTTQKEIKGSGFFSTMLFGAVFSISWTPCVGAFLGSALMLASQQGKILEGMAMLLVYSLGLGVPFVLSAVLIDKLKGTFNFIKRNYKIINIISGSFLVLVGILMATGLLGKIILSFS